MKKTLLTVMLMAAIPVLGQNFSVGVGIGAPGYYPPAGAYGAPCGPGYVWIDGYYDVNGYWVDGYCTVPPYGDAYWVAPGFFGGRWVGGYWAHRGWDRDDFRFRGGYRGGDRDGFRGGFGNGFRSHGFAPSFRGGAQNFRGSAPNNFRGGSQNFGGAQSFRGGPQNSGGAQSFRGGPQNFGGAQNSRGGGAGGGFSGHGGGFSGNGGGSSGHGSGHGGRR